MKSKEGSKGTELKSKEYRIRSPFEIDAGDHVCGLFTSEEEKITNITQFLHNGLVANDKVVFYEESDKLRGCVLENLEILVDWKEKIKSKQLVIKPTLELNEIVDLQSICDKMIKHYEDLMKEAVDEGFENLRVTMDPNKILSSIFTDQDCSEHIVQYESRLNQFFAQNKCIGLCHHSLDNPNSSFLLQILTTHPSVIFKREMFDNFYFMHHEELFSNDPSLATVNRRILNLEQRKRTEQKIIQAKEQATETSRAKSQFLATLSHEIRAPINGVLGMTEILLSMDLQKDARECVDVIKTCGAHLLTVINNVLDSARFEMSKIELEKIPFSLQKTIKEAVSICNTHAKSKGLEIIVQVDEMVPKIVQGDVTRLRQILVNLIGNAVKFSAKSPINILVKVLSSSSTDTIIEFKISDLGIGIPEHLLKAIFEHFTQVDSSPTRNYGGAGLGLHICKTLTALMGGAIEVESKLDVGSIFRVSIPFINSDEPMEVPAQEPVTFEENRYKDIRVLVAEDNTINQKVMHRLLRRIGVSAMIVSDGIQALEALKNQPYDVLFLDLHMPNCDGWMATEMIRNDKSMNQPIIITLTAATLAQDHISSLWDGYIVKPISMKQLRTTLDSALSKERRTSVGPVGS